MSKHENNNTEAEKDTQTRSDYEKPSSQWDVIIRNLGKDLYIGWLPNYIVTIVFVLCAPAIGLYMRTPKAIILGVAGGVTIAVWALAFVMIRHIPPATQQPAQTNNQAKSEQQLAPPEKPSETPMNPQPQQKRIEPSHQKPLYGDERARPLKQEGERLMNAAKYKEAIDKLNQALRISGISTGMESELKNLRIEAVTMASNKKNAP